MAASQAVVIPTTVRLSAFRDLYFPAMRVAETVSTVFPFDLHRHLYPLRLL